VKRGGSCDRLNGFLKEDVAMTRITIRPVFFVGAALLLAAGSVAALAQAAPVGQKPAAKIERLAGVWVEGPGFDVTYGGTYDGCAQKCLGHDKCVMIEYYRPEKKCNLYDAVRPRKTGGSSDVGLRR
jgi:hypothetical protein